MPVNAEDDVCLQRSASILKLNGVFLRTNVVELYVVELYVVELYVDVALKCGIRGRQHF